MTKQFIATLCILAVVGVGVGVGVEGAGEAGVGATVTVQNISVSVTDGTVEYGTLAVDTSKSTLASELNDLQTATNNGNVTETLNIRGTDSSAWTLAGTADANQYVHEFSKDSGSNWTALTISNQELATGVAESGTQDFDLQITTPTSSTDYTEQAVNVTVQVTM